MFIRRWLLTSAAQPERRLVTSELYKQKTALRDIVQALRERLLQLKYSGIVANLEVIDDLLALADEIDRKITDLKAKEVGEGGG